MAASVRSEGGASKESVGNDVSLEQGWAIKAFQHASTYFNIISAMDAKFLRLCPLDDELYSHFRKLFPDLDVALLNEEQLKTTDAKKIWRDFIETYKGRVDDFNMGTLIRTDCTKDYSEDNSFLVVRAQFLAIEVARNREGLNTVIHKQAAVSGKTTEDLQQKKEAAAEDQAEYNRLHGEIRQHMAGLKDQKDS